MHRMLAGVLVAALVAAGCGGDDDTGTDDSTTTTTSSTTASSTTTSTTAPDDPEANEQADDPTAETEDSAVDTGGDGEPVDYLTYGAGAFPVRFDRESQGVLARAVMDGRIGYETLDRSPTGLPSPQSVIAELPAPTTIAEFGIPPMSTFGCCYGTHVAEVSVEGSATSPDDGFQPLASFTVDPDATEGQTFPAEGATPVRWLRITLAGRQVPDPEDYRGTTFTELFAHGTQAPITVADGTFTGRWLTGGGGSGDDGNRIELIQNGNLVVGCGIAGGTSYTVSGGIENGLLKYVVGEDTVPKVAVINSEQQLVGAEIGRSYGRIIATPGGNETPCSPTVAEPPNPIVTALDECRSAIVYGINFDVDKADIRPDAEPALDQILEALNERPDLAVTIEGHTDWDGSDTYNADLSQRRAASVVAHLEGRDISGSRMTAVGKGESEPIADNETSAGKAANRRVEIEPAC